MACANLRYALAPMCGNGVKMEKIKIQKDIFRNGIKLQEREGDTVILQVAADVAGISFFDTPYPASPVSGDISYNRIHKPAYQVFLR